MKIIEYVMKCFLSLIEEMKNIENSDMKSFISNIKDPKEVRAEIEKIRKKRVLELDSYEHKAIANILFEKRTTLIEEILNKEKSSTMLSNSELIIMLNQSATDREKLAKFLNISDIEKVYITNVDSGEGLIRVRNSLIPFKNKFPKDTELYKLMTTKLEEQNYE